MKTPVLDPIADLISFEQAAATLGVSRRTVEIAIGRGDLRAVRLGPRCVKLERADVAAYAAKRRR